MNQEQKFECWAEQELQRNLNQLIIEDDRGGYVVFGRYRIYPENTRFAVETTTALIHKFASKKAAMSYCTADVRGNYNLASQILNLDRKKQQLSADIHSRQTLGARSQNADFAEIVNTKIEPKMQMLKNVSAELEKCIGSAKYIQIRGFTNETARIHGH